MAGPQLKRSTTSRHKTTKAKTVNRELIKSLSQSNLEALIVETPKGTSFKGELRRKCLIEIDRRAKAARACIALQSKIITKTTTNEE